MVIGIIAVLQATSIPPVAASPTTSNPQLQGLLKELQCISRTNFDDVKLPKDEVIINIANLADPNAIPALQKALTDACRYKNVFETLRNDPAYNPSAPGSATFVLMIAMTDQCIQKLQSAIEKCRAQ